jgi:hypothetical protein
MPSRPRILNHNYSMELSPSWGADCCSTTIKIFSTFYGTRRFIALFTRALYLFLFYLRLDLPSDILFLAFSPKSYIHSSSLHACYMSRPFDTPWFVYSNYICWRLKVISSSLCGFLAPPCVSSPFGPNILLSTLLSNTPQSMIFP